MVKLPTREQMLEARVADLAGYVLSTRCHDGCERPALLRLRTLINRYGRLQLRAVLKQLRCSRCKRPPARVEIADHIVDGELATFHLEVVP